MYAKKKTVFPYENFDVIITSIDKGQPRFHVKSDGCDISFTISEGRLYQIEQEGNAKSHKYIVDYVNEWLDNPSCYQSMIINREMAKLLWISLHN